MDNQRGNSNPITEDAAQTTEELIRNGNLIGDHMKNIVKLNNTSTMNAMVSIVSQDDGGNGGIKDNNNREYGGKIAGSVMQDTPGPIEDPSKLVLATIRLTATGNERSFHSHPSGINGIFGWGQPPSKQDISTTTGTINYVFGMRGSGLIYIYNKTGVIATIPIGVFKK